MFCRFSDLCSRRIRRRPRFRQRGRWQQVLQVQQVRRGIYQHARFINNVAITPAHTTPSPVTQFLLELHLKLSSALLTLFIGNLLCRFGHFARECREEEDRCYKCHGERVNYWLNSELASKDADSSHPVLPLVHVPSQGPDTLPGTAARTRIPATTATR